MKKQPGVLKEIDNLGRIVIPKDYRERLLLEGKVEVLLTEDGVLIRNPKYVLIRSKDSMDDDRTNIKSTPC